MRRVKERAEGGGGLSGVSAPWLQDQQQGWLEPRVTEVLAEVLSVYHLCLVECSPSWPPPALSVKVGHHDCILKS